MHPWRNNSLSLWERGLGGFYRFMRELSQHITDLIENSVRAGAHRVEVVVVEDLSADNLTVRVTDDGSGMSSEVIARVIDPFFTSRTCRKVGLGLSLLAAATERCEGSMVIASEPGKGTTVTACFRHSHIDRPFLGDMQSTLLAALVGHREIDFFYNYNANGRRFELDGAAIKRELDGIPIAHPSVLRWLERFLSDGLSEVGVMTALSSAKEEMDAEAEQFLFV